MFTDVLIKSLKPKTSPYRHYEKTNRAGFGIQVSPKGTKTFFYAYKVEGKQRFMKLGVYGNSEKKGEITLKNAGIKWEECRRITRDENRDPQIVRDNKREEDNQKKLELEIAEQERQKQESEYAKQGSYEQLLNNYLSFLENNRSERSFKAVKQAFGANAYKIISRNAKAKEITPDEINETLALIEKRGASVLTNRMRSYLHAAFSQGIKSDLNRLKESPVMFGIKVNPLIDIPRANKEEKELDRNLIEAEIAQLWVNLDCVPMGERVRATIKLMLVTGQRETEVLRLNSKRIDMIEGLWKLRETKNKKAHVVPLPELALDIIRELKPNKKGFYLYSSTNDLPMDTSTVSKACARYCKQIGVEHFTPRDLRRTFKTLTGKAGISKFDRDIYQNHARQDVSSKHYDMYDYLAEKRNLSLVWNDFLTSVINQSPAVIVPLKREA